MQLDIDGLINGDLVVSQTEAPRAGNLLSVQLGSLEFAPDAGVDLNFFLTSDFKIQNESFKAYLVQRLLEQRVNVLNVVEVIETLSTRYQFGVGSTDSSSGGFIG